MKILMFLLAVGLTAADKLDRTYLPPPGSKYSGGQSGDLQVPLDYSNGLSSTARPQGTVSTVLPGSTASPQRPLITGPGTTYQGSYPSSTLAPQNIYTPGTGRPFNTQKVYTVPSTTTSYAFTQTTTYSPIDESDSAEPGNQGQVLVDQNGIPVRLNYVQTGAPQQVPGYQPGIAGTPRPGQQVYTRPGVTNVYYDQNGNIVQPSSSPYGPTNIPSNVRYDQNGKIIPQTVYDKDGNIIVPQTAYDKNGNVIPQIFFDKNGNPVVYDNNGSIVPQTVYDKNGNIVPQTVYDKNGNIVPQTVYDKNGNIVPQTVYDKNGSTVPQTVYDKNGNTVPQTVYDKNGNIVPQTVYDKNGNIVPQRSYDKNGNLVIPQVVYDKNGNIVPQTVYYNNGNIIPQTIYDKNGNIIPQTTFDKNGNIIPQTVYDKNGNVIPQTVYDKNGNIIPQTTYDRNGNIIRQPVFDKNGNIVPQTVYDNRGNIEPQFYDKNGNTVTYTFDKNGNKVPQTAYDNNGNIIPQIIYDKNGNIVPQNVYDKNGNIVPQTVYDKNGNIVPQTVYDKNGNIVPQTVYDKNGNIVPQTVYDKNGNIVPQTVYDKNGIIVPSTVYDKNGNIIPQTVFDKNGNIVPQTYYDKNGNLVPQTPPTYAVRPERPQAAADRNAVILNYENVLTPEGFSYSFDTSNGIHADEAGTAVDGVKAQGGYSYIGDDGKVYSVVYSADENGFLPRGDHLPTPPPIPEAILRVIEEAKKAKEAGIIEDGSYDDNKYGYKNYQGPMDYNRPSNRNKIYDADGNLIRRPIASTYGNGNLDGGSDYTDDNGNIIKGNRKPIRLPGRRPSAERKPNANIDESDYNDDDTSDETLTVGNQRVARPGLPTQGRRPANKIITSNGQDYEVIENPDGTKSFVPVENQRKPDIGADNDIRGPQSEGQRIGTTRPQQYGVNQNTQYPNKYAVDEGQRFDVDGAIKDGQRPTSTYKGYEYLVPTKTFEVGSNNNENKYGRPGYKVSSTAKPFVTQPEDGDYKNGDTRKTSRPSYQDDTVTERISSQTPIKYEADGSPRPNIANALENVPSTSYNQQPQRKGTPATSSTLRPEFASTYRPSSEPSFGDKKQPITSTGISSTPSSRLPSSQSYSPSTTYRPNYTIVTDGQGGNNLVDEFGRPAAQPTQVTYGTSSPGSIPNYSVSQAVPGTQGAVDSTGKPIQIVSQPGQVSRPGYTIIPGQNKPQEDTFGKPVGQTLVDAYGRPITNAGSGPENQGYTSGRGSTPTYNVDAYGRPFSKPGQVGNVLPGDSVTAGPQQQRITVDEYGRPVSTSQYGPGVTQSFPGSGTQQQVYPGQSPTSASYGTQQNPAVGEDFSGPKQQQRYDSKTGYYY